MHLSLSLVSFLPLTYALQTIYIGTKANNVGNLMRHIAWFSDSDACNDGVPAGRTIFDMPEPYSEITILGHTGIKFTGGSEGPYSKAGPSPPTGVSDNGAPALVCVEATNPPSAPEYENGRYATCDGDETKIVQVYRYCS